MHCAGALAAAGTVGSLGTVRLRFVSVRDFDSIGGEFLPLLYSLGFA